MAVRVDQAGDQGAAAAVEPVARPLAAAGRRAGRAASPGRRRRPAWPLKRTSRAVRADRVAVDIVDQRLRRAPARRRAAARRGTGRSRFKARASGSGMRCPAGRRPSPAGRHRIGRPARSAAGVAPFARASSSVRPRSLRIQSTAKPKSNSPSSIVGQRLTICQLCAAPPEIASNTLSGSSPAGWAKWIASERPWTTPAMQIWLTILVSWPLPGRADMDDARGIGLASAASPRRSPRRCRRT